ncbi:hypothetical protein [Brevibacillus agri]|uniref:hypothetical protein n=1 Tax=Brevibacillus agri TaxID=51101 RepID=UPI001EE5931F|nr:hypothetical protein [Brevibacillus agri]MCG5252357.1 hypothetical protein [Brevibacillus agri]
MSGFSIPGAVLPEAEEIRSYDGRSMQDWLSPTDEKLSFIMEGGEAKGIVIATDTEPILAGGEKSGPELFALYEKIKETVGEEGSVQYFGYSGGYAFVATDREGEESVWLDQRAATFLELPAHTPLEAQEVVQQIQAAADDRTGE